MINSFNQYPGNPNTYSVKVLTINNIESFGFYGGCLGWDGEKYNIYMAPSHGNGVQLAEFNPSSPDLIFHGPPYGNIGYVKSSVIRTFSNKIVCVPHNGNDILILDPVTKIVNIISTGITHSSKWGTPVLAQNGCIYAPPFTNSNILKIDVENNTFDLILTPYVSGQYFSSVLGPNGKIYFIPRTATRVVEFDPITEEFSLVGPTLVSSHIWYGSSVSHNGKIYCAPLTAQKPLVIETDPLNIYLLNTSFNLNTLIANYNGARVLPNGDIFCSPVDNERFYKIRDDRVLRFGPNMKDITPRIIGNHYYSGSVVHPNGKLYLIPFGARHILEISDIGQVTPEMYELPLPENLPTSLYNIYNNSF